MPFDLIGPPQASSPGQAGLMLTVECGSSFSDFSLSRENLCDWPATSVTSQRGNFASAIEYTIEGAAISRFR